MGWATFWAIFNEPVWSPCGRFGLEAALLLATCNSHARKQPGVNVVITFSGDFRNFFAKKWQFPPNFRKKFAIFLSPILIFFCTNVQNCQIVIFL
jgi:hypothetical protein